MNTLVPKDTTRPHGSGQNLTAQAGQQQQQQPPATNENAVVLLGCTPSAPICLLRRLACFGYWLVRDGWQPGSSGEIDDKDLGFNRNLIRSPFGFTFASQRLPNGTPY